MKICLQSGKALELEKPDGSSETLPSGAASSLKLETYSVTFVADGSEVAVRQTVPGTPVDVTGITPEKEGYIFTTWYQDAACKEAYSQFDCVNGPLTLQEHLLRFIKFYTERAPFQGIFDIRVLMDHLELLNDFIVN